MEQTSELFILLELMFLGFQFWLLWINNSVLLAMLAEVYGLFRQLQN